MGGTRKDGILLTDDVGTGVGAPVNITSPIGPTTKALSLSVTLATDEDPIDVAAINLDIRDLLFATDKVDASGSSVSVSNFPATQPVSATSLPLPTGASTGAKQDSLLTELQLKADLTETQPVSAVSLPLPTLASTSTLQTTGNTSLASIDTDIDVALSTRASEATLLTRLSKADFEARINTLGQKTMANSTPVVLASDQSAIPISATSLPLPTNAATSALQTTGNASLAQIDADLDVALSTRNAEATQLLIKAKTDNLDVALSTRLAEATFTTRINTQGQKAMAASTPVVIASDQSSIPVAISAAVAANIKNLEDDSIYVDGDTNKALVQTPDGRLRTAPTGQVSSTSESYIPGLNKPFSLTPDGLLRVESYPSMTPWVMSNPWEQTNKFSANPW